MKLIIPLTVVALAATGCRIDADSPIVIGAAYKLENSCEIGNADVEKGGGSLNIVATQAYYVQFKVISHLTDFETTVGTETADGPGRRDFIVEKALFTYSSRAIRGFDPEEVDLHLIIPAGKGDNFIALNLIMPKAAQKLVDNVAPQQLASASDRIEPTDLVVSLKLRGHLGSGEKNIETQPVSFPIDVYKAYLPNCRRPARRSCLQNVDCASGDVCGPGPTFCAMNPTVACTIDDAAALCTLPGDYCTGRRCANTGCASQRDCETGETCELVKRVGSAFVPSNECLNTVGPCYFETPDKTIDLCPPGLYLSRRDAPCASVGGQDGTFPRCVVLEEVYPE